MLRALDCSSYLVSTSVMANEYLFQMMFGIHLSRCRSGFKSTIYPKLKAVHTSTGKHVIIRMKSIQMISKQEYVEVKSRRKVPRETKVKSESPT